MLTPKTEKRGWEGGSVGKHEDLSLNPQQNVKYGHAHQKIWETETGILQVLVSQPGTLQQKDDFPVQWEAVLKE